MTAPTVEKSFDEFWDEPLDASDTTSETPAAETTEPAPESGTIAPTEATPAPAAEAVQPTVSEPVLPEGWKKDEKGRYHRPDGTIASKDEVAKLPTAPVATATPQEPTTELAPKVEAPVAPQGEPFVFRASGRPLPIKATMSADGSVVVPPDQVSLLRSLVGAGGAAPQTFKQLEERARQAEAMAETRSKKYNDASVYLYNRMENPDWLLSQIPDEGVRNFVAGIWQRELPYVTKELGLLLKEADLSAPRAESAQVDDAQVEEAARSVLSEYIDELLERPNVKALYPEQKDRDALKAKYQRRIQAYFVDQEGQILLHENAVDADFADDMQLQERATQAARKATEDARKAKEQAEAQARVAAENARKTMPSIEAPPTAASVTKPPPKTPGKFSTKEEVEDWFENDDID